MLFYKCLRKLFVNSLTINHSKTQLISCLMTAWAWLGCSNTIKQTQNCQQFFVQMLLDWITAMHHLFQTEPGLLQTSEKKQGPKTHIQTSSLMCNNWNCSSFNGKVCVYEGPHCSEKETNWEKRLSASLTIRMFTWCYTTVTMVLVLLYMDF